MYCILTMESKRLPFKIIECSWQDSEHSADWGKLSDVLEEQGTLECRSVGFLIADKEDRIILATSLSADEEYEDFVSSYITIPKLSILWTKELRKK